jgi:RND superfamily putative drug exporter
MEQPLLARLGDLAYRRRGRIIVAWLVVFAAVLAVVPRFAGDFGGKSGTPGSDSKAAADLIDAHFPRSSGTSVNVVWQNIAGARAARPRVDRFLAEAKRGEAIGESSPPRYSRDGTIGLVQLELQRPPVDIDASSGKHLIDLAERASGNGLSIKVGGNLIKSAEEGTPPEMIGLAAAALILLVACGSIVAVGLPLLVAIFGLGISATLIGIVALLVDTPDFAPAVAGLIGIGVGIDYALLVLTRFRAALSADKNVREAIVEAVSTAGRSVIIAGGTVVISLFGLAFTGVAFLYGVAISASLAVAVVVAASVTLLPALLALAGQRVDRLRVPGLGRSQTTDGGTAAARWSGVVQRRAVLAAVGATLALFPLAAPMLGIRWGFPDEGNNPPGSMTREAYDLATRGFGPGSNGPLVVAAEFRAGSDGTASLNELRRRIAETPNVSFVDEPRISPDGQAAVLTVTPRTSPQSSETTELVHTLRNDVIPDSQPDAPAVNVGGLTANVIDQSGYLAGRIPLFIGGVLLLSFLLLLVAFRAPLIALKAGLMNLLSLAAAYGVVALAAEGGTLGSLIGVEGDTPIPPFVPVMMFAILFGLSMDYEVFLLSRIREEYLRTGDASGSVARGLAKTARVITAAAAIMVVVFLAFVFSSEVFLKLMGLGMATAILVDATIVRMVLVPAVMQLLGRANWWIPRWLDRALPQLDGGVVATERT